MESSHQLGAVAKMRQSPITTLPSGRNFETNGRTTYKSTTPTQYSHNLQNIRRESPAPRPAFQRSNSSSSSYLRSTTPSNGARTAYSGNVAHSSLENSKIDKNSKNDGEGYFTDKYYSKDFLSSAKPLSEMIKHS